MIGRVQISEDLSVDQSGSDFRGSDGTPRHTEPSLIELVRAIKLQRGWSSAVLADYMDVDERTVRRWLAGDIIPSMEVRPRLVRLIAPSIPVSSATNPLVLATLVAALNPTAQQDLLKDSHADKRLVDRARELAREIDRGVLAEQRMAGTPAR